MSKLEYVYLIKFDDNHYKIGKTKNVDIRSKTIFGKVEGEILHLIETDNSYKLETTLHKKFKNRLVAYEIFNLEIGDIEYIKLIDKKIYEPLKLKENRKVITEKEKQEIKYKIVLKKHNNRMELKDELINILKEKYGDVSDEMIMDILRYLRL